MKEISLTATESRPVYSRSQIIWTLMGVCLSMFLGALDQTVVGIAMPRVVADLGGFTQYAWVNSACMITSAVVVPIVGKFSDMYGRKMLYMIGITFFVAASVACGFAQNMTQLIVFRALQGLGGGALMTLSFTVIADLFPPRERGKYQGVLTAVFSVASVIGPTLGGYLTDSLSWHWVFFINGPLGAIILIIFFKYFPNIQGNNSKHGLDIPGLVTLILMVVPGMLALSWGGVEYEWNSPQITGMFGFAGIMLVLFLFVENRSREPIIPLYLFKNRIIAISNLVSFLTGLGMFGALTYIPLFYQGVLGASATLSGNLLIPQSIVVMIAAFLSGRMLAKADGYSRNLGIASMVFISVGVFLLSRISENTSYFFVVLGTMVIGFGMGFSITIFTSIIQNSVPNSLLGVATSSATFIRGIGGAIGLAILGSIVNNRFLNSFINQIPEDVKNNISMDKLTALAHNPQALVNVEAQAQLQDTLAGAGATPGIFDQVMQGLHQSLAYAIAEAYFVGFCILLFGLLASFFLKKRPDKITEGPDSQ